MAGDIHKAPMGKEGKQPFKGKRRGVLLPPQQSAPEMERPGEGGGRGAF